MSDFAIWATTHSMEKHAHYVLHDACYKWVSRVHPKESMYISYPVLDVLDYVKAKHDYWNIRDEVAKHIREMFELEYIDGVVSNITIDRCIMALADANRDAPEFSYLQKDEHGNIVWSQ